jgi:uncharacterized protein YciI
MPLFVMLGTDGPKAAGLRPEHRPAHLANLEPKDAAGELAFAGPLLGSDGKPCGSVIVFEAEDLEAARRFADSDPYTRESIFERVQVYETRQVFPKPRDTR